MFPPGSVFRFDLFKHFCEFLSNHGADRVLDFPGDESLEQLKPDPHPLLDIINFNRRQVPAAINSFTYTACLQSNPPSAAL